ncbi:MAG TPA: ribonuclease HI family protein [Candidatus Paceibacterota bacterium]
MARFVLFTDGGARGNPGPAGAGAVVCDNSGNVLREAHKSLGRATNNFAEYSAVILALETLKKLIPLSKRKESEIEVRMDSELVARQLSNRYEIREETLFPMFIKVHNLTVSTFPNIKFTHIRREQNKHADKLSNLAMNESEKMIQNESESAIRS